MKNVKNAAARSVREARAKLDANAKRVLSHKSFLAVLLKDLLPEFRDIPLDTIIREYLVNPEVPESLESSKVTLLNSESLSEQSERKQYLDLVFSVRNPNYSPAVPDPYSPGCNSRIIRINIEIQNNVYTGYTINSRAYTYLGSLLGAQRDELDTDFRYENLQKVVGIWILPNPPKQYRNTVKASVMEDDDFIRLFKISLGEPDEEAVSAGLLMLNVLFSVTLKAEEKIRILENKLGLTLLEEAREELTNMNGYGDFVYEQGEAKGQALSLLAVMKNSGQNLDEAMQLLDLNPEDKPHYEELLQELRNN